MSEEDKPYADYISVVRYEFDLEADDGTLIYRRITPLWKETGTMSSEEQQERYYYMKAKVREVFGVDPTPEQMNDFFFEFSEIPYNELSRLRKQHNKLLAALEVIREAME